MRCRLISTPLLKNTRKIPNDKLPVEHREHLTPNAQKLAHFQQQCAYPLSRAATKTLIPIQLKIHSKKATKFRPASSAYTYDFRSINTQEITLIDK